jgi:uncharacterized protein
MKQELPPTHLDVKLFAQAAGKISGSALLSSFERLMVETQEPGADRVINWTAHGELRFDEAAQEQVWLHLTVGTILPLTCQRCMGSVDIAVDVRRSFRFVHSEATAEAQDEDADEDVLAINPDFNLSDLIEDEVLMALPVVPRHETCPVEVKLTVADPGFDAAVEGKNKPFAVLAKLRTGKSA